MSVIFNRKDASTIEAAMNNSLEDFIAKYSNTSASQETLTKAFNEINSNKTKSAIAVKSGDSKASEPITPISSNRPVHYALDEDGEVKKVDTTNIPTRTDLDNAEFEDGKVVKKGISTPVEKKKTASKKVDSSSKTNSPAIKKATLTDGSEATVSKRDTIKALLEANPQMSNKDIKAAVVERGFKSCYDSEISAAKSK